ncbi:MAG TPA: RNA degradosome polyphosphate kinase [Dehalococcoidia bacterium]|nr:RNA degradosome polyphosphate kinase [Dehalococcoidia bacterium]
MVSYAEKTDRTPEALAAPARYLNREISHLQFNDRVLQLAEDPTVPLLERVKFLAIAAGNLDEFYMVRVAGLKRQQAAGMEVPSADGLSPTEQLSLISSVAGPQMGRLARLFTNEVLPGLHAADIKILRWADLNRDQRKAMRDTYRDQIFPILTPLAVDPGHPFPYISNRSLNLAVFVRDENETHFARLKVPPILPRLLSVGDGCHVPLEDVISANLQDLFHGMKVLESHVFRVTRDAELEVDDDGAEDLMSALEQELTRRRFSKAVRLEVEPGMSEELLTMLIRELQLSSDDVFRLAGPLDVTFLWSLYDDAPSDLKYPAFRPATHPDLQETEDVALDVFSSIRKRDILLHHPYQSFATSVQAFVEQAADDPDVLAIKQTLYRTSGESPVVDALIEAAESGKQVVVLVEIKARFDEVANINWARTLERAGCHVVYGLVGLKTHCKLCMVVRQEKDGLRRYVHIGTGNYNPTTARSYEDLGILTADRELGADVGDLFNYLTGYSRRGNYDSLLVAPHELRERMMALIDREAQFARDGQPARLILKLNALVDEQIIDSLYEASDAGVQVDIIARGICGLKPQVPGLSENIRVKSIVGRFLEHSRIFYFANGGNSEVLFGSADMMHRNLDRRVEALVRIDAKRLKRRLADILELALADNTNSWVLGPDAEWARVPPPSNGNAHSLQKELLKRARTR